uniref:Uncharacterized protein n=1 Tax=Panagrellus redivivus TaxID=6233 RepID=A0A7E4VGD7_PANRE
MQFAILSYSKVIGSGLFSLNRPRPVIIAPSSVYFTFESFAIRTGRIIVGATDPSPPVTADPLKTAKLVIYILAGLAGVILLLAITSVIYCICCKRKTANNSRDASKASTANQ